MELFDAHCHLQLSQYDADRAAVIGRMRERQIGALVVGVDHDTSKRGLELAKEHAELWAAVGLHPNDNPKEIFDADKFEELARDPKVVAIGECGLDYYRSGSTEEEKAAQRERFELQIALAKKVQKPLVVHCRDAHDDCFDILQKNRIDCPVIIHFFTGTAELAKRYLDMGCYLSFPGPITYTDMYDGSIRATPLDRTLVETDAPFAAPVPFRGKRNEPAYVEEVAKKIALLKGVPIEDMNSRLVRTARTVFGI